MFLRVVAFFCALICARSQDLAPFDGFLGSWTGSGHFRGVPTEVRYEWKRTLAGKFVSMEYSVTDPKKPEATIFAGQAIYQAGAKGDWHDSNGAVYGLNWKTDDGAVVVDWGLPNGPQGRSAYRRLDSGDVEVIDSIQLKDGAWREFAKYRASKARVSGLDRVTIATERIAKMAAFYNAVFDARLQPEPAFGTTVYRGRVAGVELLLCPNTVAKVEAKQNRKQLTFRVSNVEGLVTAVQKAGGGVKNQAAGAAGVTDPDGNTIELVSRPAAN